MHSTLFFHERQDGSGTRGEVDVWVVEAEWWGKEAARLPPIEVRSQRPELSDAFFDSPLLSA